MPKRIIGIDTGGIMAKAAVFDLDGREAGSDRRPNEVHFPVPGHTEIDAEALWRAACAATRGALEISGTDAKDIIGVSTTGMVRVGARYEPDPGRVEVCAREFARFEVIAAALAQTSAGST